MSTQICQSYLSHALDECAAIASQFADLLSPAVLMWQDGEHLVIASSDGYRMYEFRILLFSDDFASPAALLYDRILSFNPSICAAMARAFSKPLWVNEVMHAEYDDDKTTITFISPSGLSVAMKANERLFRHTLRQFSEKFATANRPHVITLSAAQALAALPKPPKGKERDLTHVRIEGNRWTVGDGSGELCPEERVKGDPRLTLTLRYLREALEIAKEYASDCIVEIPDTVDPIVVKFALGKAMLFNAYIMPVREASL